MSISVRSEDAPLRVTVHSPKLEDSGDLEIVARIQHLLKDQVEPERIEGERHDGLYSEGERPNKTFAIYVDNRGVLDSRTFQAGVRNRVLGIYQAVNTHGFQIMWPHKIKTYNDALHILAYWSAFVAIVLSGEKTTLQEFFSMKHEAVERLLDHHSIRLKVRYLDAKQ